MGATKGGGGGCLEDDGTHPIARLLRPVQRLHHAPLLISDVAHPVALARRHQHVRRPPLDVAVQLVVLLDLEALGVLYRAAVAVAQAVLAVDLGLHPGEEDIWRRAAAAAHGQPLGAADQLLEHEWLAGNVWVGFVSVWCVRVRVAVGGMDGCNGLAVLVRCFFGCLYLAPGPGSLHVSASQPCRQGPYRTRQSLYLVLCRSPRVYTW